MPNETTNYDFKLPIEGAEDALWGGFLNDNWEALDTLLKSVSDVAQSARIPIGGLYLTTIATDPATALGYGVWTAYAQGRALVGVGDNGAYDWNAAETRGSDTHALTEAEMPTHKHTSAARALNTKTDGEHTHSYVKFSVGGSNGDVDSGGNYKRITETAETGVSGVHNHEIDIPAQDTSEAGSGIAHTNVQPSIAVYVFVRTE